MRHILFVLLSVFAVACSNGGGGDDKPNSSNKVTQDQKDRLIKVTRGLGDMELVSERYKEEQSVGPFVSQQDQNRLKEIFEIIEDNMKDNESCEKIRKRNDDYDRYVGVEFRGTKCPLILNADTGVKVEESVIGVEDVQSDKLISYDVISQDLLSRVDVRQYKGQSKLKSTTRLEDNTVFLTITHKVQGKGTSQSEGEFSYELLVVRQGSGGQGVDTVSLLDATYNFIFPSFQMTLTTSMSQRGDEEAIKNYYVNGEAIERAEFARLLGTLAMPEDMVRIDL